MNFPGQTEKMPFFFCFLFFVLCPASTFRRLTLFACAGLFGCFHNPPNSDGWLGVKHQITYHRTLTGFFGCVCDLFAFVYIPGTLVCSIIWRMFLNSAQNLGSGGVLGQAESLAHDGHPSMRCPRLIVPIAAFRSKWSRYAPPRLTSATCPAVAYPPEEEASSS